MTTTTATTVRVHPARARWLEDETRMRASFLATRRHLTPFLVPHRFEGRDSTPPEQLRRAKYGYGILLNKAYLQEIFGHLRRAAVTYTWGPLAKATDPTTAAPADGVARAMWNDFTRDGVSLRNFVSQTVIEWLCSSLGGFIVLDIPSTPTLTRAEELPAGKRPYGKFVPWSAVEDFGTSATGLRWIRLRETVDTRQPDGTGECATQGVVYALTDDGRTTVQREDKDGAPIGAPVDLGKLVDPAGGPMLPLVPVRYGEHPDLPLCGTGLLFGLDDIVIDLYNVVSETREGFRDACFGMLVHHGPDPDKVAAKLSEGSRFVSVGDGERASLERLAADASEVQAGLQLIELGVKNWALSAKRQAAEAMQNAAADARSGVSLQAEFSLDLTPLLTTLAETLDAIEVNVLYVAAQLAGFEAPKADEIRVERDTAFQLEDEASRISRLVTEFAQSSLKLPPEAAVRMTLRWLEGTGLVDLDGEATTGDGAKGTVREVVEQQLRDAAEAEAERLRNLNRMPNPNGGAMPPFPNLKV